MESQYFHELKEQRKQRAQHEETAVLVRELVGELENDESMSSYSARALAIAYELDNRLGQ